MERIPSSKSSHLIRDAHFLLMPYPIQGHIKPFMKLAHKIAFRGCKVTIVLPEFVCSRMALKSLDNSDTEGSDHLRIVSVPDGLAPEDDQDEDYLLSKRFFQVMPCYMENLIKKVNEDEGVEKFTCVIADFVLRFAMEIAEKMQIKLASFFTSSPGILAMVLDIPRLIEVGIINADNGSFEKDAMIDLSPDLPALTNSESIWSYPGDEQKRQDLFHFMLPLHHNFKVSSKVLCNWFSELNPSVDSLLPNIVSVGPLLPYGKLTGSLWLEDATCLSWLDERSPRSVIYVAFGSTVKFTPQQFDELAFALELMGMPFLWVVRSDVVDGVSAIYPDGFVDRVAKLGNMVQWAPQEEVLAHPSTACFLTHCGWNSIMEAISMGVPMLCWPYFGDQFYNKSCVCNGWRVGLELNPDENGFVTRYEIKSKAQDLLSDDDIRTNALKLKELALKSVSQDGSSSKKLDDFIAELMI